MSIFAVAFPLGKVVFFSSNAAMKNNVQQGNSSHILI